MIIKNLRKVFQLFALKNQKIIQNNKKKETIFIKPLSAKYLKGEKTAEIILMKIKISQIIVNFLLFKIKLRKSFFKQSKEKTKNGKKLAALYEEIFISRKK